jgi:hypothetical protein
MILLGISLTGQFGPRMDRLRRFWLVVPGENNGDEKNCQQDKKECQRYSLTPALGASVFRSIPAGSLAHLCSSRCAASASRGFPAVT